MGFNFCHFVNIAGHQAGDSQTDRGQFGDRGSTVAQRKFTAAMIRNMSPEKRKTKQAKMTQAGVFSHLSK